MPDVTIVPTELSNVSATAPVAVVIALVCAALCAAILATLLKSGLAWRLAIDVPNERSLHERPTPRVGAWGVMPVALLAFVWIAPSLWLVALAAAFLAVVSQFDDRHGLPVLARFAAHVVAVVAIVVLFPATVPWWCSAALAFLMLWLVNLYNFMDGSDGLAGGMALFGFGGYAVGALAGPHAMIELGWASAALAGAAAGFLFFNFHPARVFLGDAGSIPLGFFAGALGYWGWRGGAWPVWFPALMFAPFIGDASVTLVKRLARGEKVWQAHRDHYYQRMIRLGVGHAATAWAWYAVMLAGTALGVWALGRSVPQQWGAVAAWAIVLVAMGVAIDVGWRSFQSSSGRQAEVDADAS